jgi:pimeloyl-ACP methyl ester carboxylesterase
MPSVLERTKDALDGFQRSEIEINGIRTVVYSAGKGNPIVYLHGAGTFAGFAFARRWSKKHRVIIPYHPGYGESADDARIDCIQDYVLHYLDLFDVLGLDRFSLIGSSLGGWLASEIAIVQQQRLHRLVLVAPSGLVVEHPPAIDMFTLPARDLLGYLVADPKTISPFLPEGHDMEFLTLRYRETTATARLTWEQPGGNPKLAQWLHRINTKTLLIWGELDRVRPLAHSETWLKLLPAARLEVIRGVGHLPLDEQPATAEIVLAFLAQASKADARL